LARAIVASSRGVYAVEHGPQREAVDERVGQHALVGRGADDRDVRVLENARWA
jgi:hypothetical protein